MRRLQKLYIGILLELRPDDSKKIDKDSIEWLLKKRAPRESFLNMARYLDARFSKFRTWSNEENAQASKEYIEKYYAPTKPDHEQFVSPEESIIDHHPLTEDALLELQGVSSQLN